MEVKGGQSTKQTAAQLGKSVKENAGTGGSGGGSFVYTTADVLLLAAGEEGVPRVGIMVWMVRRIHVAPEVWEKNRHEFEMEGAHYHGGVSAGWFGQGCTRLGFSHGERGGSRAEGWIRGKVGGLNSGINGGPVQKQLGNGGGGTEVNGASGGGGGYSGGGSGTHKHQAGGRGGSYCSGEDCSGLTGGNSNDDGAVKIDEWLRGVSNDN